MILKNVLNKCLNVAGFLILFYTFFFFGIVPDWIFSNGNYYSLFIISFDIVIIANLTKATYF